MLVEWGKGNRKDACCMRNRLGSNGVVFGFLWGAVSGSGKSRLELILLEMCCDGLMLAQCLFRATIRALLVL